MACRSSSESVCCEGKVPYSSLPIFCASSITRRILKPKRWKGAFNVIPEGAGEDWRVVPG